MNNFDQNSLEFDYPQEGETIKLRNYAFRISSTAPLIAVDISINRGPWTPCRHSCGLWWFDWSDYAAGDYQVAARGTTRESQVLNSTLRRFSAAGEK